MRLERVDYLDNYLIDHLDNYLIRRLNNYIIHRRDNRLALDYRIRRYLSIIIRIFRLRIES